MKIGLRNTVALAVAATCIASPLATIAADQDNNGRTKGMFVREHVDVADHTVFNTDEMVNGATLLIRDYHDRSVRATVTSQALEPNWAYSIWVAVFNNPEHCLMPYECALGDLGDAMVRASVFYGGGLVADAGGAGSTSFVIPWGRTNREIFAAGDWGLQHPKKAEIHIVLRSHGVAGEAGPVATQIGTANEACPSMDAGGCINEFASIHLSAAVQ